MRLNVHLTVSSHSPCIKEKLASTRIRFVSRVEVEVQGRGCEARITSGQGEHYRPISVKTNSLFEFD